MARQKQNHKYFQFGTNPMKMTDFEKSLSLLEKEVREIAKKKYIHGIQGTDGGCCGEGREDTHLPLNPSF